ncbi:MAG TPA: GNAT family N-acetyltransferase [Ktedonobacteraceae bacterium]|jgi:GNAT superfamily N-acetyltransferase|nr:GNAT family N-acetyltransferase [Ktedonobacteraceae bacterium]
MSQSSEPDTQHVGLFWTLRLDGQLPPVTESGVPATFLHAGPELAGELAQAMGLADPVPILQRFQQGKRCHIARVADQLVTYGWITFDEEHIGELGLTVRLLPGEAYIWDCGTLPEYRGRHLYPALLAHMLRELQNDGFRRVWIGMDADNLPSQAGVARAGFQPIVDILLTHDGPTRTLLARGYPDVSTQDIQAAQYALFGQREASSITIATPR